MTSLSSSASSDRSDDDTTSSDRSDRSHTSSPESDPASALADLDSERASPNALMECASPTSLTVPRIQDELSLTSALNSNAVSEAGDHTKLSTPVSSGASSAFDNDTEDEGRPSDGESVGSAEPNAAPAAAQDSGVCCQGA